MIDFEYKTDYTMKALSEKLHKMQISKRSPTIADVARQAGVSIATVSRVLNSSTPVHPDTARRVMSAIKELN